MKPLDPIRRPCTECNGTGFWRCWTAADAHHCACWDSDEGPCCRCGDISDGEQGSLCPVVEP